MFILEVDEEMTLRMLSARDSQPLFRLIEDSREYLQEWLPWLNRSTTLKDTEDFIKNSFYTYANRSGLTSGIFVKGEIVGIISFNELDWSNNIGYIGYWLSESKQGNGIMTQATEAFIDYGFTKLLLNRIDIRVAYQNLKSRSIPERLNFKLEGHIEQAEWLYDHYVDHLIYGLTKQNWESK